MATAIELNTQDKSAIRAQVNAKRTRCEVWTRVMGYHRPVSEFNPGKKSEHADRQHFIEARCPTSVCAN